MIVISSPGCRNFVSVTELCAHLLEQPALKSSAQNVGHYLDRGIVFVTKFTTQVPDGEERLCNVGLGGEKDAGLLLIFHGWKRRDGACLDGPVVEASLQLGFRFLWWQIVRPCPHHSSRPE